ncbi:uncharacterized protein LOC112598321 [Melanaphis sacchari]|uniref:uncharacterized protein LOC112598321 n=1 Tax=Melanaphis sacchari TaxID=742174 RepID=UPI000DC1378F|nr:uncharacterized protein LOC112598321 [Melanaphis sacchari]
MASNSDPRIQTKKIIFSVYNFVKALSREEEIHPFLFTNAFKITGEICNRSERAVRRIRKEGKRGWKNESPEQQSPSFRTSLKTHKRAKLLMKLNDEDNDIVRRTVYEFYDRGEYPTCLKVFIELKKHWAWIGSIPTMRSLLKKFKFSYKKCNNGKKLLMERNDIVAERCTFLRKICALREKKDTRPVVYVGETWINQNDSSSRTRKNVAQTAISEVPTVKTKWFTICYARSVKHDFVEDLKLIFRNNNASCSEYDHHMSINAEVFKTWFISMLNNLNEPSVIVMNKAPYQSMFVNNFPKMNSQRSVLEEWLTNQNIVFSSEERLSELRERVKKLIPTCKQYELDEIAQQMDHEVIRLPPYPCQYNPIESIWIKVKADEELKNQNNVDMVDIERLVKAAVDAVTQEDWETFVGLAEERQDIDYEKEITKEIKLEPIISTLENENCDWSVDEKDSEDVSDEDF